MRVPLPAREIDVMVATLLENSAGGRALTRAGTALQAAWAHSSLRSLLDPPGDRSVRARITFASVTTLTAAVVTLSLAQLGTTPRPYAWFVPSVAGAIALVCFGLRPRR
jgi:hypothetical protein